MSQYTKAHIKPNYQTGPRTPDLQGNNYPIDTRRDELQGETHSPLEPALEKRAPTILHRHEEHGSIGDVHQPVMDKSALNTWDQHNDPEENLHNRFIKSGIEKDDESVEVNKHSSER